MSDHVDRSALPIPDPTFTGRRGSRRGPPSAAEADNAGSAVCATVASCHALAVRQIVLVAALSTQSPTPTAGPTTPDIPPLQ